MIGLILGSIAGYFGGVADAVISRFTDLVMAFPLLLFLVMLGSLFDYGGITRWTLHGAFNEGVAPADPDHRRVHVVLPGADRARRRSCHCATVSSSRLRKWSARATRASCARICCRTWCPRSLAYGTLLVATNIMIEVGVTFLGAGIKLPTASWGSLLAQTWGSLLNPNPFNPASVQPWLTLLPSLAIFMTVFALNQFGEGLREATDPRSVR